MVVARGEGRRAGGYVVLLHGSADAQPGSWVPAARLGPPRGHVFQVEWLVDANVVENRELVRAVTFDLDYYLKDVGRPDPWSYAEIPLRHDVRLVRRRALGLGRRFAIRKKQPMNDRGAARERFVMAVEARIAWRRLRPPTIVYGAAGATLSSAVHRHGLVACLPWLAAGAVLWTWVEYLGHRFVLHGVFPDGPGPWRRFLHRRFLQPHRNHHAEPWNGRHVSGSLGDTAAVVFALAVLASVLRSPRGLSPSRRSC